jgi:hypothetical protein
VLQLGLFKIAHAEDIYAATVDLIVYGTETCSSAILRRILTGSTLGTFNPANFSDRIKASASARAALIDKLKSRPGPDDPQVAARAAERRAIHDARLARQAEKERLRQELLAREAEEKRRREEEELAAAIAREEELERQRVAAEEARRERLKVSALTLAEQKDRRDARYAARKSRQKSR